VASPGPSLHCPDLVRLSSRARLSGLRWALSIPGELILRAGVWLDPGITPCVKTLEAIVGAQPRPKEFRGPFYTTFRNLCSERRLSGRGLSLKVCGQLVHDTSPT
jgi:hypothetical protein